MKNQSTKKLRLHQLITDLMKRFRKKNKRPDGERIPNIEISEKANTNRWTLVCLMKDPKKHKVAFNPKWDSVLKVILYLGAEEDDVRKIQDAWNREKAEALRKQ